jgi:hypothetical protein
VKFAGSVRWKGVSGAVGSDRPHCLCSIPSDVYAVLLGCNAAWTAREVLTFRKKVVPTS